MLILLFTSAVQHQNIHKLQRVLNYCMPNMIPSMTLTALHSIADNNLEAKYIKCSNNKLFSCSTTFVQK